MTSTSLPPATSRDWFGHPQGLTVLFATEMWERFSYYGMRALLVLYMVGHLLRPETAGNVLGLASFKAALETISGPLAPQPLSSAIYGLYTGLVYLTPVLGGLIADRLLGRRLTVAIGAALMMCGHFLMAFEHFFLLALLLLILGNGAFKPNISTEVGALYPDGDARRDRAYSIFYVGINLGAFFAPLVCGTLGERFGWHFGFASAGVGMAIGLLIYLAGLSRLPADTAAARAPVDAPKSSPGFGASLAALVLLFIPSALFWAAYEQQGNTIALWAETSIDRAVSLGFWQGEIPVTWFQSFNPLMIFLFTPPLVALWGAQSKRGREPITLSKLSLGCAGLALGYLVLALAAFWNGNAPTSWVWLLVYFAIITTAELYFSPIGLSLVSKLAAEGTRSALMGVWFLSVFVGNFAAGWLGTYWSSLSHGVFFLLAAAVALLGAIVLEALRRPLVRLAPTLAN